MVSLDVASERDGARGGPDIARPAPVRWIAALLIFGLVCPPKVALADGSTIQLVPKSERDQTPAEPPKPKPEKKAAAPEKRGAEPEEPKPEEPLDLTPKPPPAALDRVPPEVVRRRQGPPVMPLIGIGLSVAAGIAGAIFLAEAGRNLDPDNFTLEVEGSGDDIEVDLTDQFIDAQNAVIGNGIAGAILVSSASAGLLASILALTAR